MFLEVTIVIVHEKVWLDVWHVHGSRDSVDLVGHILVRNVLLGRQNSPIDWVQNELPSTSAAMDGLVLLILVLARACTLVFLVLVAERRLGLVVHTLFQLAVHAEETVKTESIHLFLCRECERSAAAQVDVGRVINVELHNLVRSTLCQSEPFKSV